MTALEISCLMRVIEKTELGDVIILDELASLLKNFGVVESEEMDGIET